MAKQGQVSCVNCGATRSKRARENHGPCILVRPRHKPSQYYCARPACQAAASAYLGTSNKDLSEFVKRCEAKRAAEQKKQDVEPQRKPKRIRPTSSPQQTAKTRQRPVVRQRPAVVRQRPEV